MIKKSFRVPIYEIKVWVVIDETTPKALSHVRHLVGDHDIEDTKGAMVGRGENMAILFEESQLDLGLIAHEVSHLSDSILASHNIEPAKGNEEVRALLIGWLIGQICPIVRPAFQAALDRQKSDATVRSKRKP